MHEEARLLMHHLSLDIINDLSPPNACSPSRHFLEDRKDAHHEYRELLQQHKRYELRLPIELLLQYPRSSQSMRQDTNNCQELRFAFVKTKKMYDKGIGKI
jgi:hypothetical protein